MQNNWNVLNSWFQEMAESSANQLSRVPTDATIIYAMLL